MTKADAREAANHALDQLAARGGTVTQCPPRFATWSQANSTRRPFRRIA